MYCCTASPGVLLQAFAGQPLLRTGRWTLKAASVAQPRAPDHTPVCTQGKQAAGLWQGAGARASARRFTMADNFVIVQPTELKFRCGRIGDGNG